MNKNVLIVIAIVLVLCLCASASVIVGALYINQQAQNALNSALDEIGNETDNNNNDNGNTNGNGNSNSGELAACKLFTKAEAEVLLGIAVKEPEESTTPGATTVSTCTYVTDTMDLNKITSLVILVRRSTAADARLTFDTAREITYGGNTETVSVSGADSAYWASEWNQLSLLKGDNWVIITSVSLDNLEGKDIATRIANTMMGRL